MDGKREETKQLRPFGLGEWTEKKPKLQAAT